MMNTRIVPRHRPLWEYVQGLSGPTSDGVHSDRIFQKSNFAKCTYQLCPSPVELEIFFLSHGCPQVLGPILWARRFNSAIRWDRSPLLRRCSWGCFTMISSITWSTLRAIQRHWPSSKWQTTGMDCPIGIIFSCKLIQMWHVSQSDGISQAIMDLKSLWFGVLMHVVFVQCCKEVCCCCLLIFQIRSNYMMKVLPMIPQRLLFRNFPVKILRAGWAFQMCRLQVDRSWRYLLDNITLSYSSFRPG